MTRSELYDFLHQQKLGVVSTQSPLGPPQSAVVGIAVSPSLEIVFDTLDTSRKCQNLRKHPQVSFVIGWDGEITVQLEGIADEPTDDELSRLKSIYFTAYPDGPTREQWPGITYVRVKPTWIRYSDFGQTPPLIEEFSTS